MNLSKPRKRFYAIAALLGLLIIAGIYEFIQYRNAQRHEEGVRQIVEQMQKEGLSVSMGENGVVTVRP